VRLIGDDNEQLGIMPTFEALQKARELNLDLVEVAPMSVPPVCKILDYGRFKYEQDKKDREARKNQVRVEIKEIRLRPKIGEHDFEAKARHAEQFLDDGDKVKVTVQFRGRELAHPQLGRELLSHMAQRLKDVAVVERNPMVEGKTMHMILTRGKSAAGGAGGAVGARPARSNSDGSAGATAAAPRQQDDAPASDSAPGVPEKQATAAK
jgi:translation initiation factor IF-3